MAVTIFSEVASSARHKVSILFHSLVVFFTNGPRQALAFFTNSGRQPTPPGHHKATTDANSQQEQNIWDNHNSSISTSRSLPLFPQTISTSSRLPARSPNTLSSKVDIDMSLQPDHHGANLAAKLSAIDINIDSSRVNLDAASGLPLEHLAEQRASILNHEDGAGYRKTMSPDNVDKNHVYHSSAPLLDVSAFLVLFCCLL